MKRLELADKLSLINKVALECMGIDSLPAIIKSFTDVAGIILGSDYGYAFMWKELEQEFELFYQDKRTPFNLQTPRKNGITSSVFESREPIYVSHVATDDSIREDAKHHMRGVVVIPITYQRTRYGVLGLCFYQEHIFSDDEKTLCAYIGHAAAQALTINNLFNSEKEARKSAQRQESRFRSLIENSYDVILLLDVEGKIIEASSSVGRVAGYEPAEVIGRYNLEFTHPEDAEKILAHMQAILDEPQISHTLEFRYRHRDGSWRWLEASGINMLGNPNVGAIVANLRDVTERKTNEATIKHQALHDPLTDLPNRQEFNIRADQSIAAAKRNSGQMALMFLDMDRFKTINDRLGHAAGDTLLKVISTRLSSCLREEDVVARFGGDEFLILINSIHSSRDVVAAANKILKAVNLPVKFESHTLYPSVSVGISIYPDDGLDRDTLKKNADIALYRAKGSGRNRFNLYDHSLDNYHQAERFTLENELRQAVMDNQIELYYQPIISLINHKILAVEALARWQHPHKGLLMPEQFLDLATEIGLMAELDTVLLKKACAQVKAWREQGLPKFRVSVNLSPQQFDEPNFLSVITESLDSNGLRGADLELEITEQLAMGNLELTNFNLNALKKLGIKITIDDFGIGYSSLNYLKTFPIHKLKIDKSFVRHCITNSQDTGITKTIIAMAKALNLKVVAEGVETQQQLDFLASLNCDAAQGFFVAPPMPADQLAAWLSFHQPVYRPALAIPLPAKADY